MASGILEVSPTLLVCGQWNGQSFLGQGKQSPVVWLQGLPPESCVGQGCGDRIVKTQSGLSLGP